jgi:P-type E1-E2 ATPase
VAGRYLEALSKQRTGDAITELNRATATTGFLFTASEGATSALTEEVDAAFLEIGDLLLVAAGSSPPLDGILADDSTPALFDDSMLTGEARPVLKQPGDAVYAGTINSGPAAARLRLTSHLGGSMVDGIASAVREAMGKKAGIERIADTVTAYFVPAIVGIACLTLGVWLLRGYTGGLPAEWLSEQQRGQGGWALFGIEFAVAVLVVACPCGALLQRSGLLSLT